MTRGAKTPTVRLSLMTDDTLAPLSLATWGCLRHRLVHLLPQRFLLDGEPFVVRYAESQTPAGRYGFISCRVALGAPERPDNRATSLAKSDGLDTPSCAHAWVSSLPTPAAPAHERRPSEDADAPGGKTGMKGGISVGV